MINCQGNDTEKISQIEEGKKIGPTSNISHISNIKQCHLFV